MTTSDSRAAAAAAALEIRDWDGAEAAAGEKEPRKFIFSVRINDPGLADWIAAETDRRGPGTTPSDVIRDAIASAKAQSREQESEKEVTVRMSDLHRVVNEAIDRVARPLQDA
jgi:hypothetical protein